MLGPHLQENKVFLAVSVLDSAMYRGKKVRSGRETERRGECCNRCDFFFFFFWDRTHVSQNIYRKVNQDIPLLHCCNYEIIKKIYIIQQLDESVSKSDIIYI
ncbi:hypothetical protein SO802_004249 [Lithocarpus litseifolius]|uniref:Uncharacterized protein n=1 Tax=Lithocarpus litseifolius TaxID=425828 RepID=A0AAW2E6A3_9ROSI